MFNFLQHKIKSPEIARETQNLSGWKKRKGKTVREENYSYYLNIPKALITKIVWWKVKVLIAQLCPTLCKPMDCSPPGSSVHKILQARILEWVCYLLLQGIFPTQGSNLGLLHCRWILYCLNQTAKQGSPVWYWYIKKQNRIKIQNSSNYTQNQVYNKGGVSN